MSLKLTESTKHCVCILNLSKWFYRSKMFIFQVCTFKLIDNLLYQLIFFFFERGKWKIQDFSIQLVPDYSL